MEEEAAAGPAKYLTTEQELLAIVELLKEFQNMLLGKWIRVYTDQKNLTYEDKKHGNNLVLRQHLVLEEFSSELVWLAGDKMWQPICSAKSCRKKTRRVNSTKQT